MLYSKRVKRTLSFCGCVAILTCSLSASLEAALVWSAPQDVSLPAKNAVYPQVTFDPAHNATAIWSRSNGNNYVVEVSQSKIGGIWSHPNRLSHLGQNAFLATIAHDNANNSVAAWSRSNGNSTVVQAAYKVSHGFWSAPVDLSVDQEVNRNATQPQIAVDSFGNVTVVWQKYNGLNNVIQVSQKKYGGNWSNAVKISGSNSSGEGDINPQITVDPAGTVYVVWINKTTSTVQWVSKTLKGEWSDPVNLSSSGMPINSATVTLDLDGYPCAAWSQSNGTNYVIQTRYQITGRTLSPIRTLSLPGYDALNPQISVDALGNRVVVWQRFDGLNTIVQASMRYKGNAWGAPINLSVSGQDASQPQVQVDAAGNIVAVWRRSNGTNFVIEASTATFDNPTWSTPVILSVSGEDAVSPQLSLDGSGNVVAVWQRSDGSNSIVQAAFGVTN